MKKSITVASILAAALLVSPMLTTVKAAPTEGTATNTVSKPTATEGRRDGRP